MKRKLQRGSSWHIRFQFDEDLVEPINAPKLAKAKEEFLREVKTWVEVELPEDFDREKELFLADVKRIRPHLIQREMHPPKRRRGGH